MLMFRTKIRWIKVLRLAVFPKRPQGGLDTKNAYSKRSYVTTLPIILKTLDFNRISQENVVPETPSGFCDCVRVLRSGLLLAGGIELRRNWDNISSMIRLTDKPGSLEAVSGCLVLFGRWWCDSRPSVLPSNLAVFSKYWFWKKNIFWVCLKLFWVCF